MDIFQLFREWGFDKNPETPRRLAKREVERMLEGVEALYVDAPQPKIGSLNIGLRDSLELFEPRASLKSLALPSLLSACVWLPDPFFSAIAPSAGEVWTRMPDSGGLYFVDKPAVHTHWKHVSQLRASDRKDSLRATLRTVVPRLLKLEPLVRCGAVRFYSWERLVADELADVRGAVAALEQSEILKDVTTSFPQSKYSLGVRVGGVGVTLKDGDPTRGVAAGANLWLADKKPVLVYGILNAIASKRLASRFSPTLPGDRVVYDFVRTNGRRASTTEIVGDPVRIPALDTAVWADVIAIRRDHELLARFRDILGSLGTVDSDVAIEGFRCELESLAAELNADISLQRVLRPSSLDFLVATLGGAVGAAATGGSLTGGANRRGGVGRRKVSKGPHLRCIRG